MDKAPYLKIPRGLLRGILILLVLLPATCLAEEEIILLRNDCYASLYMVYCHGSIKNTTERDINNVIISFSSPYLKTHAPQVKTDVFDEIEFLPADETYDFKVVWDAARLADKIDPDILREYILTSIENKTMEVNIFRQMIAPDSTQTSQKAAPFR